MSKEKLQEILRKSKNTLLKAHECELPTFMVVDCVGHNTIRAFHKGVAYNTNKPTILFNHWAYKYLTSTSVKEQLRSAENFNNIHSSAINSLRIFWKEKENGMCPHWYLCAKLVDLLFRFTTNWAELNKEERQRLFEVVNVPVDRNILLTIREFDSANSLKIPKNPSMGFIKKDDEQESKKLYGNVQTKVKEMAGEDFSPMLFELYSWNKKAIGETDVNKLFPLSN